MKDRFKIVRKLGSGGFGEVHLAWDATLKRYVAVKRLHAGRASDYAARAALRKEGKRIASLQHKGITAIHEFVEKEDDVFLVMEYVEGTTLREKLFRTAEGRGGTTSISIADFASLAVQIVEAVEAAHEKGIVHQDLKPENILISQKGDVKICDFGLARALNKDPGETASEPTLAGTRAYMAPERFHETSAFELDKRSDCFSLGVIFYELLTGRNPFSESSLAGTIDRIRYYTPPPPSHAHPSVPIELDELIAKLLSKDRKLRASDASEILPELRHIALHYTDTSFEPQAPLRSSSRLLVPERKTRQKLVVLPFAPIPDEPAVKAFADGLTDTVVSQLGRLTIDLDIHILPTRPPDRSAVTTPEEARQILGATLAIQGSLQRFGEAARANFSLIDTATLTQVSSDTLTVPSNDPFKVQDQVVLGILRTLHIGLVPAHSQIRRYRGTRFARAQDFYLQACGYLQRFDEAGSIDYAIDVFKRALQIDMGYALAWASRGQAYWRKYENTKDERWMKVAKRHCEKALQLDANLAAAHACEAMYLAGTGHYEEAILSYQHALESDPANDLYCIGLAQAYEQLNKVQSAEEMYKSAVFLKPSSWATHNSLGVFYSRQGRYQEASEVFERLTQLVPDSAKAYTNLGGVYDLLGRTRDAQRMMEKAYEINSKSYQVTNNLGTLYYKQLEFEKAAQFFRRALKLNAADYRVWGYWGSALELSGNRKKAVRVFRRAIKKGEQRLDTNPKDPRLLLYLAMYYGDTGDLNRAKDTLGRAFALDPADPEIFFDAAVICEQRIGDREAALKYVAEAVQRGFPPRKILEDPTLERLRGDARFAGIVPLSALRTEGSPSQSPHETNG